MWFILGIIVLAIAFTTIEFVVSEKVEDKKRVFFIGGIMGSIITLILVARIIMPETKELENKVNELTTKLYESYSLRDSLSQSDAND